MTYAELDRRANQLAHRLVALGVGPEVPVGLMLPRSLDYLVAVMGVLKAGGAFIPMDPMYPPDRLAVMLEDSKVLCRIGFNCCYLKHGPRIDVCSCLQAPVLISQERFVKQSAVTRSHVLLVRP